MIRGHNVMKGYWGRPDATAETIRDGWFHSGDMATVDEDGYFFIVDRKKDMIIRGGYNVYPREIEEVLYEHPAVREAAVIGVPDDEYGEEVGAAVTLKDGASVSADELRDFVKEQVAAYKYPRYVWFVDDLPKGPTGQDPQARDRASAERLSDSIRIRAAERSDVTTSAVDDHRTGRLRARRRSGHGHRGAARGRAVRSAVDGRGGDRRARR